MIGVVAKLKIKPEMTAEFEAAASALVAAVNANETDCLMYELYKSPQDHSSYVFMENTPTKPRLMHTERRITSWRRKENLAHVLPKLPTSRPIFQLAEPILTRKCEFA